VNLTWQAPSSSSTVIAGYNVYRMVNGGTSYVLLNSSSIAGTAFSDSGVSSGTTYLYYVTSVDQNKTESTPSATTTVSIP
jgi:cellulose 1,4-beta-cellobiosidase